MPKKNCASWSSGKLGELFKVKADVSRVCIDALATLTRADARNFLQVGLRGSETHHVFLTFPLSEIEHPNL
jgi:hypothetical protein